MIMLAAISEKYFIVSKLERNDQSAGRMHLPYWGTCSANSGCGTRNSAKLVNRQPFGIWVKGMSHQLAKRAVDPQPILAV